MLKKPLETWRSIGFRKLLYLPRILSVKERLILGIVLIIFLGSGLGILNRLYTQITKSVPDIGGNYIEGLLREPRVINPIYASTNDTDRDIVRLIYSSLITYDGNGSILFDLAETHTISEDGKIHTLTIKKDIQWHDGAELTADDIFFTIKLIQNPQYQSPLRTNWQGVTIERIDQYTVQFTLRTPYVPFIENLTVGILPKHLWENISPEQALLHELNLKPVGSGPYVFKQFQQNRDGSIAEYQLRRNRNYYREGPYLKEIVFKFFRGEGELITALRRGAVDGFGPIADASRQSIPPEKTIIQEIQIPRIFGIFFNQKVSPLDDSDIREAIAYALDRKRLVQEGTSGGATPYSYPLPPTINPSQEKEVLSYAYDPERSKKILDEAGWIDVNEDGIREKDIKVKDSKTATTTALSFTLTTSNWSDLTKGAEAIKTMLADVGIQIIIKALPLTELETAVLRPRDFELLLFGHVYGYEPDPFSFWHSSQIKDPGLNITLYTNKNVDALLEEARQIPDPITRQQNFEETAAQILEDLPATFLYSQLYLYALPSAMQGATISQISLPADRFNEINKWHLDTKRVLK